MSNKPEDFSNAYEERFNAPFASLERRDNEPLEPDLILETAGHRFRFVVLFNALSNAEHTDYMSKGAITLGLLDPLPREPFIYNQLRAELQAFTNRTGVGHLLMTLYIVRFSGMTIEPRRMSAGQYPEGVTAVIKIDYIAARPISGSNFKHIGGNVWQEVLDEDKADGG